MLSMSPWSSLKVHTHAAVSCHPVHAILFTQLSFRQKPWYMLFALAGRVHHWLGSMWTGLYRAFLPEPTDVSPDYWEWLRWRLSQVQTREGCSFLHAAVDGAGATCTPLTLLGQRLVQFYMWT
jgi:hypothetical protein